jgi:type II secretory pathway pseudopilin PulG
MPKQLDSQAGVSLVETLFAVMMLTIAASGMASVFLFGMQSVTSAPNELVATQKAAEAIESVFSARDSHTITWQQLRNVSDGGIFVSGPTEMRIAGSDGILNTADDASQEVEKVILPGPDQILNTADDVTDRLTTFTREVAISELTPKLREITVVITYQAGSTRRTYTLTALISAYA